MDEKDPFYDLSSAFGDVGIGAKTNPPPLIPMAPPGVSGLPGASPQRDVQRVGASVPAYSPVVTTRKIPAQQPMLQQAHQPYGQNQFGDPFSNAYAPPSPATTPPLYAPPSPSTTPPLYAPPSPATSLPRHMVSSSPSGHHVRNDSVDSSFSDFDFLAAMERASKAPLPPPVANVHSNPFDAFDFDSSFGAAPQAQADESSSESESSSEYETDSDDDSSPPAKQQPPARTASDAPKPRKSVAPDNPELAILSAAFENEQNLRTFLLKPYDQPSMMHCQVTYDRDAKVFRLIHAKSSRVLMTSFKRIDGFKMMSPTINCPILMNYHDAKTGGAAGANQAFVDAAQGNPSRLLVAKVRSNPSGSLFQVFDNGKNPSKARGMMEARRELGAAKFTKVSGIFTRRKVTVAVPFSEQFRRPKSKDDSLLARRAAGDPTVHGLVNHLPNAEHSLPKLEHFEGLASKDSIKNLLLHDPAHPGKRTVLVVGKLNSESFNVFFRSPISPAVAFGLTISTVLSYVHPQHQT